MPTEPTVMPIGVPGFNTRVMIVDASAIVQ